MSPEHDSCFDWLRFARSDLAVAKRPAEGEVLLETLCFHAQQAVEKSLKAVLVAEGTHFPRTHNLKILLDVLPAKRTASLDVRALAGLTHYATATRYPGDYEDVTEEEYREAVRLAEAAVAWAKQGLDSGDAPTG